MSKQQGAGQHLRQQKDEALELNNQLNQQLSTEKENRTVRRKRIGAPNIRVFQSRLPPMPPSWLSCSYPPLPCAAASISASLGFYLTTVS
jgi:hypothetical protein